MTNYLPLLNGGTFADQICNDLCIKRTEVDGTEKVIPIGYPNSEYCTYSPEKDIKIGLVIGTYAAVPYVHLGLESWKRNYYHIPVLVHDDASSSSLKLKELCKIYNVCFSTNSIGRGHPVGDISSFISGWLWAIDHKIDLLVKFSRRFIPLYDWTVSLEKLARETQSPTFSNICLNLNWGFRTECVAMHIPSWQKADVFNIARKEVLWKKWLFAESFWHEMAKTVAEVASPASAEYLVKYKRDSWCAGYAPWDTMGTNRIKKVKGLLWHHSCTPEEYYAIASSWNLPYKSVDFGPKGAKDLDACQVK